MYLRCPYCGSTDLEYNKTFGYKTAFWGALFLHFWGALLGFFLTRKKDILAFTAALLFRFSLILGNINQKWRFNHNTNISE